MYYVRLNLTRDVWLGFTDYTLNARNLIRFAISSVIINNETMRRIRSANYISGDYRTINCIQQLQCVNS